MKQSLFTMEHARQLTADTYELVLSGDTSAITAPGQFVNIQLPGKFLRRPISICNWTKDALLLLVRVVGEGTHDLVRCVPGTELDVLSGLGNGFDLAKGGAHPILLGGGIGNLIDRVLNGEVVDYINLLFMRFAVFNFADICVCVGVALWVLVIFLEELHEDTKKGPKEQ
mgnify:CR=1 FL=1